MKKSNYNIFIKKEGFTICYNSFTHTVLCVSNNVYEAFTNMNEIEFKSKYTKQYEAYVSNGFLISENRDELDEIRLRHKIATFSPTRHLRLMVYPTQDCNLKCWYCYEAHVKNSKMEISVQDNIVKFIERKIQNKEIDSFFLSFFGGEPLLFFNEVAFPLSFRLKELCDKHHILFTTFFITNGSLIDDNNIDKLKSLNSTFQITLDGDRAKHDKVRIGKEHNAPTYEKIIKALHLISENISCNIENFEDPLVTLRINYDNKTLKNIDNLLEDIKDLNRSKFLVHFERVWQTMESIDDEEQNTLLFDTLRKFIAKGFSVNTGSLRIRKYACPAEDFNHAIINYDGYVYRCNGRTLEKEAHEGILTADGHIEWNPVLLSKRLGKTTFENPMCLHCKMLPVCMGPCSQKCMELDWKDLNRVCSLKTMGVSINQYLSLLAERLFYTVKYEKLNS